MTVYEYIEVKSSGIHRHGVFAKIDIPKNIMLVEYKGNKVTKDEGTRILDATYKKHLTDPENHAGTYIFELDEDWDIDGDIPNNDAKYINHSCEPNCEMKMEDGKILIYSARDIKKGEEITYNYGFEINKDDPYDFEDQKCRCGSKKCIGYILDEDEWPKLRELINKKKDKQMKSS